jgi:hypothetical protein
VALSAKGKAVRSPACERRGTGNARLPHRLSPRRRGKSDPASGLALYPHPALLPARRRHAGPRRVRVGAVAELSNGVPGIVDALAAMDPEFMLRRETGQGQPREEAVAREAMLRR